MTHSSSASATDRAARHETYNAAFHELGLDWFWDAACGLLEGDDERVCLRGYLARYQPHLLTVYDADFLVDAILAAKARCMAKEAVPGTASQTGSGKPGATDWRALQQRQIGI